MIESTRLRRQAPVWALLLAAALPACQDTPADRDMAPDHAAGAAAAVGAGLGLSPGVERELEGLRQITAPFQDVEQARAAGYHVLVTHPETGAACLSHESHGGMGFHYLNPELVDAEVDIDRPEAILYEEAPDGSLRLVAVEYVIPFDLRPATEPPPVLFGQEFVQNHTFDLWALHVWVWKPNPSGVFADYNPDVICT